jgi:hypothetical protein
MRPFRSSDIYLTSAGGVSKKKASTAVNENNMYINKQERDGTERKTSGWCAREKRSPKGMGEDVGFTR